MPGYLEKMICSDLHHSPFAEGDQAMVILARGMSRYLLKLLTDDGALPLVALRAMPWNGTCLLQLATWGLRKTLIRLGIIAVEVDSNCEVKIYLPRVLSREL